MFEVGMKVYTDKLKAPGIPITKLVMEYLCMLFKPEEVEHVIRNVFKTIDSWTLYESSGVYALTMDTNHLEYFLVDRVYNHSRSRIEDNYGRLKIIMEEYTEDLLYPDTEKQGGLRVTLDAQTKVCVSRRIRKTRFAFHEGYAKQGFGSAAHRPVGLRGLGVKHPLELTFPDQKGYIDIS
ncbi:hypothetical protein L6452_08791 [Arctium lappa]|uniref:Uncharacterized protein n=1 Tax=Arctium lappa TaxID=4217 RepID=A0ACB9DIR0_ARCLA|nr:hypothetical protein L6452_08791 [Arctium lappa]